MTDKIVVSGYDKATGAPNSPDVKLGKAGMLIVIAILAFILWIIAMVAYAEPVISPNNWHIEDQLQCGQFRLVRQYAPPKEPLFRVKPRGLRETRPLYATNMQHQQKIGRVRIGTPCGGLVYHPVWAKTPRYFTVGINAEGKSAPGVAVCESVK